MRHRKAGRSLRRTSEQRLALLRSLATSLIQQGALETTEAKAKELRPFVEKLITKARTGTLHARRLAGRHVHKRAAADKLFQEIGPRFAKRPGGYTRITKLGPRHGDDASMSLIELVERGDRARSEAESWPGRSAPESELSSGRAWGCPCPRPAPSARP